MSASLAGFREFPWRQFDAVDDGDIEFWLAKAATTFDVDSLGDGWPDAAYYYTAHQLSIYNPTATTGSEDHVAKGPVTSEKIMDQSRSYGSTVDLASVPPAWRQYASTTYGQHLLGILMSRAASRGYLVTVGSAA